MADSSAPLVSSAVAVPAADNALPKNPRTEAPADKPAEATAAPVGAEEPLSLAPETSKQGDAPATESTGTSDAAATSSNGVNGTTTGAKSEPVIPEEKKADTAAPAPTVETAAASSAAPGPGASESTAPAQVPVMTGALASSEPKPVEPTNDDGVKDASAVTATIATTATTKPAELNGASDKDVEMKDSTDAAPAPETSGTSLTAPVAQEKPAPVSLAAADPTSSTEPGSTPAETGEKRKAEAAGTNGATADEEPAEKKQKQGVIGKVVKKAKEVVEEVREKTESKKDNGPTRKGSKKGKKEAPPAPVGRTARKTRSQGTAD
ncbi:hypothetical protein DHEL01_v206233 [Diaporthe helianthi]|uniref:Uncharacterized protein n=1 Tax=Diaporthe helianthi TaxID=158607 RepID=A0A2P5HYN8_DIAHE|nr:hypothetical protein DHEL01_v206233 [Diaporthe helianthi]